LSILLILKGRKKQSYFLLALVLIFFGLTEGNSALLFGLYINDLSEFIPYLRLELIYGLGPSLYLYSKSVTNPEYKIQKWEYLHFLPVLFEFIYYRTSFYRLGVINFPANPQNIYESFFLLEQWIGAIFATFYMVLAIKVLFDYKKWLNNNFSNLQNKTLQWLNKPVIAFVSFWILWFTLKLGDLYFFSGAYTYYYSYPMFILLSVITIWIGFQGYSKTQIDATGFLVTRNSDHDRMNIDQDYSEIISQIKEKLEKDKLYLDQDLNITTFSNKINISSKLVSRAVNTELNINFHKFINQYRVNEFKKRLAAENSNNLTLLAHALDSGFSSKSTFNDIFKKLTKLTPKEYYSQIHKK
jgi:AraC-like DNA-binding protein